MRRRRARFEAAKPFSLVADGVALQSGERLRIDVWSDIVCPWCYVGRQHLLLAIDRAGLAPVGAAGTTVDIVHHAYELSPDRRQSGPLRDYFRTRFGTDDVDAVTARVRQMGEAVGLRFDFHNALAANTFDAHRLVHLARSLGGEARGEVAADAMLERFMRAHFAERADLADRETLVRLAADAGVPPDAAQGALQAGAFADEVRGDEDAARRLGIGGVPFFVFGGRFALSGAQPVEVFEQALRRVAAAQTAQPPD